VVAQFSALNTWAVAALCGIAAISVRADVAAPVVRVAVAANFQATADELCRAFFRTRPGHCVLSSGASGLLFAKVTQGAPFDVFLSADATRPERLESQRWAVAGSRFTYALGRLVFWRPGRAATGGLRAALDDPALHTIAIANPGTAPYGVAAVQTLRALDLPLTGRFRLVRGESVAQAFQFVASGATDAGFVAWTQLKDYARNTGRDVEAEACTVDDRLHAPIEQQAVLLSTARGNRDALALLAFMRSAEGKRIIESAGYGVPGD
jgi:molybdate transport system substrate-binding protein